MDISQVHVKILRCGHFRQYCSGVGRRAAPPTMGSRSNSLGAPASKSSSLHMHSNIQTRQTTILSDSMTCNIIFDTINASASFTGSSHTHSTI